MSNGVGGAPGDSTYFNCNRLTTIDSMSSSVREVVRRSKYKKNVSPNKSEIKKSKPEPISPKKNSFINKLPKDSAPKADARNVNIICEGQLSIQEILARKGSERNIQSSNTPVRSTRDSKREIQHIETTPVDQKIQDEVGRLNSGLNDLKNLEREQEGFRALLQKRDIDFSGLPQQPELTNSVVFDGSHAVYIRDMNHKVPILKRNESDVIINNFSLRHGSLPSGNLIQNSQKTTHVNPLSQVLSNLKGDIRQCSISENIFNEVQSSSLEVTIGMKRPMMDAISKAGTFVSGMVGSDFPIGQDQFDAVHETPCLIRSNSPDDIENLQKMRNWNGRIGSFNPENTASKDGSAQTRNFGVLRHVRPV